VVLIAVLFAGFTDHPQVQAALRGMSAVAAGLIAATGLKLLPALRQNVLAAHIRYVVIAITFISIVGLHMRLIWVLLGIGGASAVWAYRCLKKSAPESGQA
jgi:chromate transporter